MKTFKKAIILAGGFGTRLLPVTKAVPKEMLPVLNRPAIDFTMEECLDSGITDICIVISRGKEDIIRYFGAVPELDNALTRANKRDLLPIVNKYRGKANVYFVIQPDMRGTGKATELCKEFVGNDPVAILFPDDIIYSPQKPVTKQLIDAYETTCASAIVGVQKMQKEDAVMYGVIDPAESKGRYTRVRGFIEKPSLDNMPSTLTSLGRFIVTPDIFEYIGKTKPVSNGEVYLPSAIDLMAKVQNVYAYEFDGTRYDIGNTFGFLQANIDFALRDAELREKLKRFITQK